MIAVANGADVDGWADVSGPSASDGVQLATLAPALPGNGLVVMAPSDGRQAFDAAAALARSAGVPFVAGRSGHGWELLVNPVNGSMSRIGRRLLELAEGRPGPEERGSAASSVAIWRGRVESAKMFRLLRRVAGDGTP